MAFGSKFFSLKGQKERLTNVGKYFQLGASKITAGIIPQPKNTQENYRSSSTFGNIAQAVVNNPKTAALIGTGAAMAARRAPSVVKKATQFVKASRDKGIIKPTEQTGGMIKSSVPTSTAPVSPNAGIITPAQSSSPRTAAVRRATPRRRTAAKPRKRRTTRRAKRKGTKRRSTKRKKRIGTAKQYARKGGKSVKYTKNGQPYIILNDGRARFVKGKRK